MKLISANSPSSETLAPLHVCFFSDSRDPSGMGEHMLTLAAELASYCRLSMILTATDAGCAFLARADALKIETLGFDPACSEEEKNRITVWLRRQCPDIFHIHAGVGWEGCWAPGLARAAGVKIVVRTEHLPYLLTDPADRARHAASLEHVDRLICVSGVARRTFVESGISPSLVTVVHNGIRISPSRRRRAPARAHLGLDANAPLFLTVARLTEQKGHDTLIQALPAVRADAPDARVLLAGTGPREPALRELVRELKLEEAVSFLGHRKDIPHLMAAADAFVLPSRFEGHPIVVLEAMAAGLPVIATDVCGTSEAIDANVTGLLVPPEDPEALASAMQLVLARPSVARRLAVRARSSVTQNFSAAVMAHKTLAIYRAMLTEAQI